MKTEFYGFFTSQLYANELFMANIYKCQYFYDFVNRQSNQTSIHSSAVDNKLYKLHPDFN